MPKVRPTQNELGPTNILTPSAPSRLFNTFSTKNMMVLKGLKGRDVTEGVKGRDATEGVKET